MFNGKEITSCPNVGREVAARIKNTNGSKLILKVVKETWFLGRSSKMTALNCVVCGYTQFYALKLTMLDP